MKEPVIEAAVREAVAVGRALGVRGTPSLVIKGVMFEGLPTANELRRLLSPDAMSSQEILKLARQMDAGRRKSSQR
jgi:predicted DsbA family dithiol-disulfide isomerase